MPSLKRRGRSVTGRGEHPSIRRRGSGRPVPTLLLHARRPPLQLDLDGRKCLFRLLFPPFLQISKRYHISFITWRDRIKMRRGANTLKRVRTVLGETTYPWRRLFGPSRPISSSATVQRRWTSEATAGEEKSVDGEKNRQGSRSRVGDQSAFKLLGRSWHISTPHSSKGCAGFPLLQGAPRFHRPPIRA